MDSVIVLGIVMIWILVLVPMWLNRHEADNATRSMDSFSAAMRVLSRRTPARADRRYVVMPRRDSWGVTVDNDPAANTAYTAYGRSARSESGRSGRREARISRRRRRRLGAGRRARVLARRRRLAVLFVLLTIGLAVSAFVAHTSWWFELAAGLALAGYVIHLRNEAIRSAELRRRRLAHAARLTGARSPNEASFTERESFGRRDRVATSEAVAAVLPAPAVSASGTENGSRWEPVPVPLPTYVSKPVVQRTGDSAPKADVESGAIDLTRPVAWIDADVDVRHLLLDETGSGTISSSAAAKGSRAVFDLDEEELDLILERRRAVGD